MIKKLFALLFGLILCQSVQATVLFPFFVDIAPEYEEGLPEVMREAGVDCGLYHGTKPDFLLQTFTGVEGFYKDTLPDDVMREERMVGKYKLVKYYTMTRSNDTIKTDEIRSAIYVLELPDNRYMTVYCESSGD